MLKRFLKKFGLAYFLFIFSGILCLPLPGGDLASSQPSSSLQIYFFSSEDCQPCQVILQSYLPTLKTMFPTLEVKTFDMNNPSYYEALTGCIGDPCGAVLILMVS